jgi:hypothetical protein
LSFVPDGRLTPRQTGRLTVGSKLTSTKSIAKQLKPDYHALCKLILLKQFFSCEYTLQRHKENNVAFFFYIYVNCCNTKLRFSRESKNRLEQLHKLPTNIPSHPDTFASVDSADERLHVIFLTFNLNACDKPLNACQHLHQHF